MSDDIDEIIEEPKTKVDPFSDKAYEQGVREAFAQVKEEAGVPDEGSEDHDDSGIQAEQKAAPSEDEEKPKQELEEPEEKRGPGRPKKKKTVEFEQPPIDWSAEGKEFFKKQPKEAQKEWVRISNQYAQHRRQDYEKLQQGYQQIQRQHEEIGHLKQAVRPFSEQWARKGITEAQGILQGLSILKAFQEKPVETSVEYLKSLGYDVQVPNYKNGVASQPGIGYQEVDQRVQQHLAREREQYQARETYTRSHQALTQEITGLIQETNQGGDQVYKDLSDPGVQQRMQGLFQGIVQAYPQSSLKDKVVMTYRAAGGRISPHNTPSLVKNNKNNNVQAARRAMSSTRSSFQAPDGDLEFIPGESHEDSARRAYQAVFGNRR